MLSFAALVLSFSSNHREKYFWGKGIHVHGLLGKIPFDNLDSGRNG
jgi:hypothetical protein